MEKPEGALCRRAVVAQHEVQHVVVALAPQDGIRGIVLHEAPGSPLDTRGTRSTSPARPAGRRGIAIEGDRQKNREGPNAALLEGEGAPGVQDAASCLSEGRAVAAAQAHHGGGPAHDARLHAFQAFNGKRSRNGRVHQGEAVAAALEVVVAQKGAADDGQIGVGADEPLRIGVREIEQPRDGVVTDGHGAVLVGRHDEMLGEVAVGREPPGPRLVAKENLGHGRARAPQTREAVLPRRFPAQVAGRRGGERPLSRVALHRGHRSLAFPSRDRRKRRTTEGCPRRSGDVPRILLGLGQVDGDLQGPCRRIVRPERIAALVHGTFRASCGPAHGSRLANTPGPPTTTSRQAR